MAGSAIMSKSGGCHVSPGMAVPIVVAGGSQLFVLRRFGLGPARYQLYSKVRDDIFND